MDSVIVIIVSKSKSRFLQNIVWDRNRDNFNVGMIFSTILTLFTSNV